MGLVGLSWLGFAFFIYFTIYPSVTKLGKKRAVYNQNCEVASSSFNFIFSFWLVFFYYFEHPSLQIFVDIVDMYICEIFLQF